MASSDMANAEPWSFRPSSIDDPWSPEALSRDTQTLTEALAKFISDGSSAEGLASAGPFSPILTSLTGPEAAPAPAFSSVSVGSDPEPATSKRQRGRIPVSATPGRVSKRKPRPSKRSRTTFFTADPSNFRQMVQEVTGVRLGGCSQLQAAHSILNKPEEAQRPSGRFSAGTITRGCLPTLDTSAFLLDHGHNHHHHHHHQQLVDAGAGLTATSSAEAATLPYVAVTDSVLDIESFASFPTLESWNAYATKKI